MPTFSVRRTAGGSTGGQAAVLGGEALERPDRDRLVEDAAAAGAFARRGADPAADRRERIDLGGDRVGLVVAACADQPDVSAGVRAGRAGDLAGCLRARVGPSAFIDRQTCHASARSAVCQPNRPPHGDGCSRLSASRVTLDSGSHGSAPGAWVGGPVDRPLAGREGRLARLGDEGHHDDRAFADADAAADAFADLDRVLHHPGLRLPDAGRSRCPARSASTCRAPRPDRCPCRCRN